MRKILLFLSLWSASLAAAEFPIFIDPVVNATPPGAKVTAGYFTLVNETEKEITITDAYSPTIAKVEIHLSSVKDDVATMEKQDSVSVKAGDRLEFIHGSYHLMLMELSEPLKEDDLVDVILVTSIGEMLIEMPVKKPGTNKTKHNHVDMKKDDMKMDEHAAMKESKHAEMEDSSEAHADMKKDGAAHKDATKTVH